MRLLLLFIFFTIHTVANGQFLSKDYLSVGLTTFLAKKYNNTVTQSKEEEIAKIQPLNSLAADLRVSLISNIAENDKISSSLSFGIGTYAFRYHLHIPASEYSFSYPYELSDNFITYSTYYATLSAGLNYNLLRTQKERIDFGTTLDVYFFRISPLSIGYNILPDTNSSLAVKVFDAMIREKKIIQPGYSINLSYSRNIKSNVMLTLGMRFHSTFDSISEGEYFINTKNGTIEGSLSSRIKGIGLTVGLFQYL